MAGYGLRELEKVMPRRTKRRTPTEEKTPTRLTDSAERGEALKELFILVGDFAKTQSRGGPTLASAVHARYANARDFPHSLAAKLGMGWAGTLDSVVYLFQEIERWYSRTLGRNVELFDEGPATGKGLTEEGEVYLELARLTHLLSSFLEPNRTRGAREVATWALTVLRPLAGANSKLDREGVTGHDRRRNRGSKDESTSGTTGDSDRQEGGSYLHNHTTIRLEDIRIAEREAGEIQNAVIARYQLFLDQMKGKSGKSGAENKIICDVVYKSAQRLGVVLLCHGQPAYLTWNKGVFVATTTDRTRGYLDSSATFLPLIASRKAVSALLGSGESPPVSHAEAAHKSGNPHDQSPD